GLYGRVAGKGDAFGTVGTARLLAVRPGVFEQAGVELHRQESADRLVDGGHWNAAGSDRFGQGPEAGAFGKVDVDPSAQGDLRRFAIVLGDMMEARKILDCVVVGDDRAPETPFAAQDPVEQPAVRVARNAVDLVVAGHHRVDAGAPDDLFERREEELAQLALAERGRGDVDAGFGLPVPGHVLERGEDLVRRKRAADAHALKPFDRGDA